VLYAPAVAAAEGTETREHAVRTNDGRSLHAEVTGDGPTVLLIQGLGYATWAWAPHVPALAERFRVIAFDNRGAGRSDKPDEPYSIELLAEDAHAVVEQLGTMPAHIAGMSMGGYIALTLARLHPDAVASLALISTTCGGSLAEPVPDSTLAAWAAASALDPLSFARATMPISFAPGWTEEHPDAFEELLAARLAYPTPAHAWRRQFDACEEFLSRGLDPSSVTHSTLVVHGTADRVVPYGNAELLADGIAGAELLRLEGAGHLALLERQAVISAALLRFFA
jgi:pimeloyl-ACP methyl ester carboxylesterase